MVQGFPDTLVERLASLAEQRVYNPGDVLIQEGKKTSGVVFLVRGQVKQSTLKDGENAQMQPAGELLGVEGLLTQKQVETFTA